MPRRAGLRRAGLQGADALLATGFPLASQFPESGVFRLSAGRRRDHTRVGCEAPSHHEEEVGKGWLRGPLDRDALAKLGRWIPSRRFAVVQGAKTWPIDDYTLSKVNAAVSTYESFDPADIDHIAANCRSHGDAQVRGPSTGAHHRFLPTFRGIRTSQVPAWWAACGTSRTPITTCPCGPPSTNLPWSRSGIQRLMGSICSSSSACQLVFWRLIGLHLGLICSCQSCSQLVQPI